MDSQKYIKYSKTEEEKFEAVCKRCGECCGALDDPCRNLVKNKTNDQWFCKDYKDRYKQQKTISGNSFTCVSIREHMRNGSLRLNCAYRGG